MNIKSILLGSAAAFVAVSGARAADAVTLVEPEPVEYVRVCDVYGTGYFYIPGTETCLKIGGYVRMRVNVSGSTNSDLFGDADFFHPQNLDEDDRIDNYNLNTQVRARLDFDAREETELGTLRAFIRVQATNIGGSGAGYGTSGNGFIMDQGYLQLGGLTIGKLDSLWAEKDGLYTDNDWSVGDISTNQIRYTFAPGGGFSISGSVEDDGDGDFIPDVVAQVAYEGGFGSAYISGIYDEDGYDPSSSAGFGGIYSFLDDYDVNDGDGAFALKAGVELKDLIATDSLFKIEGHYAFDPTEFASLEPGGYLGAAGFGVPSEYQIGAAYQQTFGKFTGIVSGVYGKLFDGDYDALSGFNIVPDSDNGNADYFGGAVNVGYAITSNFSVDAEVSYRNVDSDKGGDHKDQTFGYLEFKRSF